MILETSSQLIRHKINAGTSDVTPNYFADVKTKDNAAVKYTALHTENTPSRQGDGCLRLLKTHGEHQRAVWFWTVDLDVNLCGGAEWTT